jgi:hypothetical protein
MAYEIEPSVRKEVERVFKRQDVDSVLSQLSSAELPMERNGPAPRIHMAVLILSKGDLERFEYELDGAQCDWRDTLMQAGLANANWKEVLKTRGIDCDDW